VSKASIAAVLVAFGIIALVQKGTNAMVMLPAGLLRGRRQRTDSSQAVLGRFHRICPSALY
jgi:hypothetical protein